MNVADFWFQHSPMLGHCALSHTVCRFSSRAIFFRLWKVSPIGAFAFSHAGLAAGPPRGTSTPPRSPHHRISPAHTRAGSPVLRIVRLNNRPPPPTPRPPRTNPDPH